MTAKEERDMWLNHARQWESLARGRKSKNRSNDVDGYEYCLRQRNSCIASAKEAEARMNKSERILS